MRVLSRKLLALAVIATFGAPITAQAEVFTLPDLPYGYDALAPVIDAQTMETHHSKHHQGYVNNLNAAIAETEALNEASLMDILSQVSNHSAAIRNNAGGHWNHAFFWQIMAPQDSTGAMSDALKTAIDEQYGSVDAMKEAFNAAGSSRFGSGWVWLIVNEDKALDIVSTPNQDNPLMDDAPVKGTPILGNDVWEHAYYLNYQNKRGDYLDSWWDIVNWDQVSRHYEAAIQ